MMTFLRTFLTPRPALLAAAVLGFLAAPLLRAADFEVYFDGKAGDNLSASVNLRPGVQMPLFVFVRNNTGMDKEVLVELLHDDVPVDGTVQLVKVNKNKDKPTRVVFGSPAAPPPPPVPGAPAAKPQPPALQEVKGALQVVVLDKDTKEALLPAVDLPVARPDEYVKVASVSYNTEAKDGNPKNTLIVQLEAGDNLVGAPSHVELVLRPDRIPGLVDSPHKEGTRGGYLGAKGKLTLKAQNLQFEDGAKEANGLVYLTVDGWERAFTFYTTFLSSSGQAGQPTQLKNVPVVRLNAPIVANPGDALPVSLEVDMNSAVAGKQIALAFDRGNDMGYSVENGDLVMFPSDREVRMLVGVAPDGALLLQPQVQDWKKEWDAAGVFGPRVLQLQVRDKAGKALGIYDSEDVTRGKFSDELKKKDAERKTEVTKTVLFDAAPPEAVQLFFPEKLRRGAALKVQAATKDNPEDIKEVLFYIGKPGPDGKPPATVETVKGVRRTAENAKHEKMVVWEADLPAPTDTKGTAPVTAEFVKLNKLATNGTATVTFEDAAAPGAPGAVKPGSIAGVVFEAGQAVTDKDGKTTLTPDARTQQGIEVQLVDEKGAVKAAMKTDAAGKYLFKDVPAGSYKVTAAKTTDSTAGQTAVQVVDGVNKTDVNIKLTR